MRYFVLGALLLLTAGCGAYRFPAGQPGTVSGTVIVWGCGGPVQPASLTCAPNRPLPGAEINIGNSGTVLTAVTASDGTYSIHLPAATYKVSVKPPMAIVSGPTAVTVGSGASVVANYVVDVSIRVPVPQQ